LRIHSVNTIINDKGILRGDTTDGPGFLRSAEAEWGSINGSRILILGAGGSAKAVAFALADVGCEIVIANRTCQRAVELVESLGAVFGDGRFKAVELQREVMAEEVSKANLLINTTSIGMYPNVNGIPLPSELLHPKLLVYDIVYNPIETRLVAEAGSIGAKAVTGIKMLVYQGALSLEMWTGMKAPIAVMEQAAMGFFEKSASR
jgi:shikimate dehydrogenase